MTRRRGHNAWKGSTLILHLYTVLYWQVDMSTHSELEKITTSQILTKYEVTVS